MNMKPYWIAMASLAVLLAQPAASAPICFESDKVEVEGRTAWSHHHYVLWFRKRATGPDGKRFFRTDGYGWDDAQTLNGSVDLVPVTGSAVTDVDGSVLVGIKGTLIQFSALEESGGIPSYYLISEAWRLDPTMHQGTAFIGNLSRPFMQAEIPGSADDYYRSHLWRVPCTPDIGTLQEPE